MASIDDTSSHGVTSLSGSRHNTGGNEDNKYNDVTKSSRKQNALKPVASSVRASVQPFATRLFGNDAATNDVDEGEKKKSKNKQIAQWPYDDYHEIQNRYYQVVDNAKLEDEATPSYVHRPQDMPDIPTAVQGLPLPEFAMTAEDRAIGIVSTWIFDAGLIDELLLEAPIQQADAEYDEDGRKTSSGGSTQKMDKEIAKLREQTARDLALINSRLNDGVAASGSEVQELVNAVEATKSDLTRLRQLTTYISNGGNLEHKHSFLLTNHPKLKTAINSRRNLARCFRELDFFSQIPSTCERMREQLNSCEWTDHEWTTIRDVCREHVELQIFLVEAEAGMKARMDLEGELETTSYDHRGKAIQGLRKMGNSFRYAPSENNHDSVDRFLNEHVKNVWEVGDEIRLRVLSGVGSALDLARQDPAGMVALIEAVEVYESAADEYRRVHGGVDPTRTQINNSKQKHMNSISDMRRAALEHIADDFQARGEEVFNSMIQKVKEDNTDPYADLAPAEFNAVLRAAQSLTYQIELVRQHMTPCFPPFWNVDTLWMTCVAAVCSEHIMHHIGGQKGDNLSYMTVTQLLDLVAWIESFREKVEESFPNLIQLNTRSESKTNFISMKELMKGKEIDMKSAKENLSWVTNVLWDVHRLAQDQFILRTQDQTQQWLENVYRYVT
jgi:Exocyst complex component Sec6